MMAIIFAVLVAAGMSDEWQTVTVSTTGTIWKIRQSDIANESNITPIVWVNLDYSNDKTTKYRSSKRKMAIDCKASTYQMISVVEYDSVGSVAYSNTSSLSRYSSEPIVPDTVMEKVAQVSCPTGTFNE